MTHALRVSESSDAFLALFVAIEEQRERAGWLDLAPGDDLAPGGDLAPGDDLAPGGDLDAGATRDGPWKSVRIEPRRTVAVKTRRGPPVLRDLLREHYRGCRVVLVRGGIGLPALRPRGADWELESVDGRVRRLTTAELLGALRSPHLGF